MPQQPHGPTRDNDAADEHGEALQSIADLLAGSVALGNSKDDGGKYRKQQGRREMGESEAHFFFPIAMWYASTAAMRFSNPATIMYFVP